MAELKIWKDRLQVSERKFKGMGDCIKKWRNYYRGIQWGDTQEEIDKTSTYRDKTVDNMVFANIRTIMPSINFNNPKIFVDARRAPFRTGDQIFDTNAAASLLEALINYDLQELQLKKEVDKALLDALLGPWGIIHVGYTAQTEKIKGDTKLEVNELIQGDSPFAVRISPLDFRVDVEAKCSHLNDANWVATRWIKTLDEVKKNPKYENTKGLKPNSQVKTDFSGDLLKGPKMPEIKGGEDLERVEGWDIWDLRNERLITTVDTHDKFLRNEKGWPLEFDGYPFETLYFNENPDELFPISDVDIYMAAQDELNRFRSLQLSHAKRISQRKYIARSTAFQQEELDKIENGPDGAIAETEGDPNTAIVPLRDAGTSQDIYIAINQLKQAIGEGSSVAQFERGIAQKFDTATEPALIAQGVTIKRAERLQTLEDFYVRITKKLAKIRQQTLEEATVPLNERQFVQAEQTVRNKLEKIVGPGGSTILMPWLRMNKEDIKGDFDFRLDVGSTQPINQEKRKQDAVTLGQILAGNPYIDEEEGTRRILEAFEEKDIEALMKTSEQVAEEQEAATQSAQQGELLERQMKDRTDLLKTQIKSDTQLRTTLMKVLADQEKGKD